MSPLEAGKNDLYIDESREEVINDVNRLIDKAKVRWSMIEYPIITLHPW